jgi:hypothetical protein
MNMNIQREESEKNRDQLFPIEQNLAPLSGMSQGMSGVDTIQGVPRGRET